MPTVHPLLVHLDVGLDVVGEYFHVQLHTLLSQGRLHKLQDFRVGNRSRGDGQFLGGSGNGKSGGCGKRGQCFLDIHNLFSCVRDIEVR